MTNRKYIRLVMVLFVPLLVAGYAAAKLIWPYDPYGQIACAPFMGRENCRYVGFGALYESVRAEHPTWFDVHVGEYDKDAYLRDFVEASGRMVPGATILSATPFVGNSPEAAQFMKSFAGKDAILILGIPDQQRSIISDKVSTLYCNDLWLDRRQNEYTSGCYGNGWSGSVTYKVNASSMADITQLRNSIEDEIADRRMDFNIFRIFAYPIFIYVFFIISLFVWIFIKAVRFVKNG